MVYEHVLSERRAISKEAEGSVERMDSAHQAICGYSALVGTLCETENKITIYPRRSREKF
jgi:hypothetical protein